MDRRGFLGAILAAACAPAIVRASSLMPGRAIVLPTLGEVMQYAHVTETAMWPAGVTMTAHPTGFWMPEGRAALAALNMENTPVKIGFDPYCPEDQIFLTPNSKSESPTVAIRNSESGGGYKPPRIVTGVQPSFHQRNKGLT
jgi:hypothetical protein